MPANGKWPLTARSLNGYKLHERSDRTAAAGPKSCLLPDGDDNDFGHLFIATAISSAFGRPSVLVLQVCVLGAS